MGPDWSAICASTRVLEINQPHEHTRRRRGKSDSIDAEMAARLARGLRVVEVALLHVGPRR